LVTTPITPEFALDFPLHEADVRAVLLSLEYLHDVRRLGEVLLDTGSWIPELDPGDHSRLIARYAEKGQSLEDFYILEARFVKEVCHS